MFIKYFIPEDGDEQAHPNVFKLESSQPSFSEVKKAFPVPGTYHFRFLKNIGSHIVWLDVTDDGSALPTHQGSIFIKATRVAAAGGPSAAPSNGQFVQSVPQEPTATSSTAQAANTAANGVAPPPVKAPKPTLEKKATERLLNFDDSAAPPVSAPVSDPFSSGPTPIITPSAPAAAADGDLLGINMSPTSASSSHKSVAPAAAADFFGLDTLQPTQPSAMGVNSGHSTRSMSPMGGAGMNPMGGGHVGMNPMGAGSVGSGMNAMGGGGMGGGMGGRGMAMGGGPMGGRGGMGAASGAAYDPFSSIGSMQAGGRGAGPMGGRR